MMNIEYIPLRPSQRMNSNDRLMQSKKIDLHAFRTVLDAFIASNNRHKMMNIDHSCASKSMNSNDDLIQRKRIILQPFRRSWTTSSPPTTDIK